MTATPPTLDALFAPGADTLSQNAASLYDETVGNHQDLLLYGAGRLGQLALAGLRKVGKLPHAFVDSNQKLWGGQVDGLKVMCLEDAANHFGLDVPIVVTIYTAAEVRARLRDRGFRVVPFAYLALKYPEVFLPHGALDLPAKMFDQREAIQKGYEIWADDASRAEYLGQVNYRLTLDTKLLPAKLPAAATYFPEGIVKLTDHESFVDCGAFDGDSIRAFLERVTSYTRVIGFEPDPGNGKKLREFVAALPAEQRERFGIRQTAVGNTTGKLRFSATGTAGSALGEQGSIEVDCNRLDDLLADEQPTFIKMDIEGAEPEAIEGGKTVLARDLPVLAVCLYHAQDHLWKIPLMLRELSPRYRLYLRRHSDDCWEQVCYAIPEERVP